MTLTNTMCTCKLGYHFYMLSIEIIVGDADLQLDVKPTTLVSTFDVGILLIPTRSGFGREQAMVLLVPSNKLYGKVFGTYRNSVYSLQFRVNQECFSRLTTVL